MALADLDISQLSSFCALPQSSIQDLLDAPTAKLVQSLLRNISTRAQEFKGLESDRLRSSVEIENTIRTHESKNRTLKSQLDKANSEVTTLRQKWQTAGNV